MPDPSSLCRPPATPIAPATVMNSSIPVIAGFESTWLPQHQVDITQMTNHQQRWRSDVDMALLAGAHTFRYPLRWHAVERDEGRLDWREADRTLGYLRDQGAEVIVDLLHHTSYPAWLTDGFRDRRFGA